MWWSTLAHLFHPRRSNNHRPRVLHPAAYIVYLALGAVFVSALHWQPSFDHRGSVLGFASSITPAQVIEQTNQERRRLGLSELTSNPALTAAAQSKGRDMFSQQYWAHVSPTGKEPWAFMKESGYEYQAAGENLARDFSETGDMVRAWMGSPTHRANIVNPKYSEIGIAVVDGTLQGYETTLVVQMFGQPRQVAAQVAPGRAETTEALNAVAPTAAPEPSLVPVQALPPAFVPASPQVLARALVPQGSISRAPLFSPLQLSKVFFLSVIMMVVLTLTYDWAVIGHRRAMRLVGHNAGHIIFLLVVAFLLMLFKGGIIN